MKLLCACLLLLCLGPSLAAPADPPPPSLAAPADPPPPSLAAPADPPPPSCCVPEQYEGRASLDVGMSPQVGNAWNQGYLSEATVHYDYKNSKTATLQEINRDGKLEKSYTIEDSAAKLMYIFNPDKQSCKVYPVRGGFQSSKMAAGGDKMAAGGCQPLAGPLSSRTLGWDKDVLKVIVQEKVYPQFSLTMKNYYTESCMPVSTQFIGAMAGIQVVQGQVFSNMVKGIKDPSVFHIPSYCDISTPEEASGVLNHVLNGHLARRSMYP